MLIVGRFLTGRRARQRTACFGTKGLALLNNANIASTDRPACLIASAAYCRVSYSTGLASIASHGALIARLQSAPAKPQSRAVLRKKRPLSLGQTRAWTTPDNRCFLKKWRLGRCNFEQWQLASHISSPVRQRGSVRALLRLDLITAISLRAAHCKKRRAVRAQHAACHTLLQRKRHRSR